MTHAGWIRMTLRFVSIFSDQAAPATEFIGRDPADSVWPDFSLKSRMKLMSLAAFTLL